MATPTTRTRAAARTALLMVPLGFALLTGCSQREERSTSAGPLPTPQPRGEIAPTEPQPQAPRPGATPQRNAESPKPSPPPAQSDAANPARPQQQPSQDSTGRPQVSPPPRPDVPPFVRSVEPIHPTQDATITADFDANGDLLIATDNVRRFRIVRRGMPMPQYRNLIVRIDKQNIEWTERYAEIELQQARSGLWEVARSVPANR